jgi:hypothetical protein
MKTAILTPLQEELTFLLCGLERLGLQKLAVVIVELTATL